MTEQLNFSPNTQKKLLQNRSIAKIVPLTLMDYWPTPDGLTLFSKLLFQMTQYKLLFQILSSLEKL